MVLQLRDCYSFLRVPLQHPRQAVSALLRHNIGYLQLGLLDVLVQALNIAGVEGWDSDYQLVEDCAQLVDVS